MPKPKPVQTNFRTTPEMHEMLEIAAEQHGISINKEINSRLLRSFETDTDTYASGEYASLSAILKLSAEAMQVAGNSGLFHLTQSWDAARKCDWIDEPYAYDQACMAAQEIMLALRPTGEMKRPDQPLDYETVGAKSWAWRVLKEAATGKPSYATPETQIRARSLHKAAGRLAERISNFLKSKKAQT